MKKIRYILILLNICFSFAQKDLHRIENIKNKLEILSAETVGLTENVKTEINVSNITLSNFLLAVSDVHKVNINVSPELNQINIVNNFTDVTVSNLLIFLCKEHDLTIDFTGNILSVKKYKKEEKKVEKRVIPIAYNLGANSISIDAKEDQLYDVFKHIMDETSKNLVFSPGLGKKTITAYIKDTPFDAAMDKLAFANNLYVEKSKDGFYIFEDNSPQGVNANSNSPNGASQASRQRPKRRRNSNFFFKVLNADTQLLEVDFVNTPIADIINDISNELKLNVFTAAPLDQAGSASFKAKTISYDALLTKIFESQTTASPRTNNTTSTNNSARNNSSSNTSQYSAGNNQKFNFKKEGNIYFFGTENQLSIRTIEVITLQHRSVELLSDPSSSGSSIRSAGRNNSNSYRNRGGINNFNNSSNFGNSNGINNNFNNRDRESLNTSSFSNSSFNNYNSKAEALVNILPDEVKQDLDIRVDTELNSFYVSGPNANIKRFKNFIAKIDKPVPVVLIEVMIIEVRKSSTVKTGVSWGIGSEPAKTQGGIFPQTDFTLGANTINKIIGGFDGFGSFNLGKVVPDFFAKIEAMESNGDIKVRSTPKLSTLNGHRATFSNGQTSYYAITQQAIIGSDNPLTQTAVDYVPIDAQLGLTVKPLVSGDGQVTLDISVIQSDFGNRIAENAPPDITSKEFSSIIRMRDQDIAILGGLEERSRANSGTGIPLLARIPIIKWLFSSRTREARKDKLTVLIKPTVIY